MLDELSLGESAWQRRHNVNVIGNTADMREFGPEVAADCCEISMHAWPHIFIEPWLTLLRTKDDMDDDLAERLRHWRQ